MIRRIHFIRLAGFSLLELLVAMAVFLLIAVLAFSVLEMISSACQQGQGRIGSRQTGRTIIDMMGSEVEAAVLPVNRGLRFGSGTLTAQPEGAGLGYQLLVNPPQLDSMYRNPNAIFFQAPMRDGRNAEIGYFVRWDESIPGNPRGMLCRFFARPGEAAYRVDSQPLDWLNNTLVEQVAPGVANDSSPELSFKGHFADNVIGLWVRSLDPDGNPIVRTMGNAAYNAPVYAYDSRMAYRYTPAGNSTAILKKGWTNSTEVQVQSTLPPVIEIAIVVLDLRAAQRLTEKPTYPLSSGTPTAASFWKDIDDFVASLQDPVRQGARVFSTRVMLKNAD